jgi:hypothetical protein
MTLSNYIQPRPFFVAKSGNSANPREVGLFALLSPSSRGISTKGPRFVSLAGLFYAIALATSQDDNRPLCRSTKPYHQLTPVFGRIAKTFGARLSPGGNLDVKPNLLQI